LSSFDRHVKVPSFMMPWLALEVNFLIEIAVSRKAHCSSEQLFGYFAMS
jgi:hypothetical protein